jgi:hypothetical protein
MWTNLSEGVLELFAEHAQIFHGRELVELAKKQVHELERDRQWEEEHRADCKARVGQLAVSSSVCPKCGACVEKREGFPRPIHFGACKKDRLAA